MKTNKLLLFIFMFLTQISFFMNPVTAVATPVQPDQQFILYYNDGTNAIFFQNTTNMGEFLIPKEIPSRPDYDFLGWASQPNAILAEYQPGQYFLSEAAIIELYGVWQPKSTVYVLIYDANGGDNAPNVQTSSNGRFKIPRQQPSRPGYKFKGWSTEPDATEIEYYSGDTFRATARQNILYAIWEENLTNFTLIYESGGPDNPPTQTITAPSTGCIFTISAQAPQRPGYLFMGWATTPDAPSAEYQPGEQLYATDLYTVLYALWQENFTYTLEYDSNGGTDAPASQIGQTSETFYTFTISSQIPKRPNYIFLGWSQFADSLKADFQPDQEITVTEPLTLYAVWQEQIIKPTEFLYTLTYHPNGGNAAPPTQTALSASPSHTFQITQQQPNRAGYDFLGWSTQPDSTYAEYQPNDNFTTTNIHNLLYAVWSQTQENYLYQIIFSANGGISAPPPQTAYGTSANCLLRLPEQTPVRPGYTFSGWAFAPEAESPSCFPGESIIITKKLMVLYAVWQQNQPPAPTLPYLQRLLGNQAVILNCQNQTAGHYPSFWPLLPESFSCQIEKSPNGRFTAILDVSPELYLQAYNSSLPGHQLTESSQRPRQIKLTYYNEFALWLPATDYQPLIFNLSCITPNQPQAEDLQQILGTSMLVTVQCVDSECQTKEHFAAAYGLLPEGLEIGPVQIDGQNNYTCQLTFWAEPYLAAYKISYGPHQLAPESAQTQTVLLVYDPAAGSWRKDSPKLPFFPVIAAPEPEPEPIYNYSLTFDPNGGQSPPFPQSASTYEESMVFIIPQEKPTRPNDNFLGWATEPDATDPAYHPKDLIILRSSAPEMILYAVWQFNQPAEEKPPDQSGNLPNQPNLPEIAYCLYYDPNGGDYTPAEQVVYSSADSQSFDITYEQPKQDELVFAGWALSKQASQADYQAGDKIVITRNQPVITLYAVWQEKPVSQPPPAIIFYGDDSAGSDELPPEEPEPTKLNQLHLAYVQGYPDGTIRPDAYITYAEAALLFCRIAQPNLLNPQSPGPVYTIANDVQPKDWYYDSLTTLPGKGLIQNPAGNSLPTSQILTRAELVTLALNFNQIFLSGVNSEDTSQPTPQIQAGASSFTDISGHWAAQNIKAAETLGWIKGYPDKSFRPDQPATRAETICLLNRMLKRQTNSVNLKFAQPHTWRDNPPTAWFYAELQEAGNSHYYRLENDTEIWLAIQPNYF